MASYTPNLDLLKKDPVADAGDTFNIKTMMNDNWDKIDGGFGTIKTKVNEHLAEIVTDLDGAHGFKYEEGNWTPTLKGTDVAGTHTYSLRNGKYIRKNKEVWVTFNIILSAKDTKMNGDILIDGLPFVMSDITPVCTLGLVRLDSNADDMYFVGVGNDNTSIVFYAIRDNGFLRIPSSYVLTNTIIQGTMIYKTNV